MNDMILAPWMIQVLLPSALIVAPVFVPDASRVGIGLRTVVSFWLLLYAALAGLWLFPPWWRPYLLMVFLAIGSVYRYGRT